MKMFVQTVVAAFSFIFVALAPVSLAQDTVVAVATLPNSGTYFIVNRASGEALQPVGPSVGQNVELYPFNRGGTQKWTLTRFIDPVTKKPTNRYNIRLAGDTPELELQPHDISDRTAVLLPTKSVFVLKVKGEGFILESSKRNGDAMFSYPVANMQSEAHFAPNDGSDKFVWAVLPAE